MEVKAVRKGQIESVQFLRFIALLFVFYTHITYSHIVFATCGVSFFVVLSGFLYGYKEDKKEVGILAGTWSLFKNKLSKFYLLHLVTLILSVPFERAVPSMGAVVKNMLLLQCFSDKDYFLLNGVSWFLSLMLVLALVTIPLKRLIQNLSKNGEKQRVLVLLFACLVVCNFAFCYIVNSSGVNIQYWLYVCLIVRIMEYTCGMIVGYLFVQKPHSLSVAGATVLEMASILIVGILVMIPNMPQYIHRNFIWVIPTCFILYVFSMEEGWISRCFKNKYLKHFGLITFEIFMTHQVILRFCEQRQLFAGISFWGQFFIKLILCILFAEVVSYVLKKVSLKVEL